ncbi:MAG: tRNA-intron lyase [Methanomassiliicoccales archaeon]|nr:MAG: tRNA-intron lyase [Methanomassiliicoccales archaeon]
MPGELRGDFVIIEDQSEASQIYNRGYYGYPQRGGSLELDIMEAIYLTESDRLKVFSDGKEIGLQELVHAGVGSRQDFHTRFLVYRDLRQRGYIVKLDGGDFDFRIFPRGGTPTTSQTKAWVLAVSERSSFSIVDMLAQAEISERTRKELLLAVVDEEGDITYYEAERADPHGELEKEPMIEDAKGILVEDSVLVIDEAEADALIKEGFYGKKVGRFLQLSLIEAAHLQSLGRLTVRSSRSGRNIREIAFNKRARAVQPDFDMRLKAFTDLRSRGLVVKTGFKYGTHFRVYEGDPGNHHSKYLVHAVPEDYVTIWAEVSRAIRLAHGVKKEVLFGRVGEDRVQYAKLKRVRP